MRMLRLVCLALVSAALYATPAVAQAALQDSVTGAGVSPEAYCNGPIEIDVHSGPSGDDPTGHVTCGTLFDGPPTCLNVQGNVALLTVFDDLFGTVSVRITDAGSTGDTMEAFPTPGGCPGPLPGYVPIVFSGDIVVVDAPPRPTSKDQCKSGGWRTYGVFKNQGDCVSYVVRQATKACLFERAAIGPRAFRDKYGIGRFDLFAMLNCIHRGAGD